TLEKGVMGAEHFLKDLQALSGGKMNMGAWHGHQEVIFKKILHLGHVKFDLQLPQNSYLIFLFNKSSEGFSGIRFSLSPYYKSMYFKASTEGKFITKNRLENIKCVENTWQHIEIGFHDTGLSVVMDGTVVEKIEARVNQKQVIGFRGGGQPSYIDNVSIHQDKFDVQHISFDNRQNFLPVFLVSLVVVLILNLIFFVIYRLQATNNAVYLFESKITFNMVTIVIGALVFCYQYYSAHYYPIITDKMKQTEEYWRDSENETILKNLNEKYGSNPGTNTYRILFLGTSQTWGAGAARTDETFVARIEEMLNSNNTLNRNFECINGGMSSANSPILLEYYRRHWLRFNPQMTVVNLSNNDKVNDQFKENLVEFIELGRTEGIKTVLIEEPNAIDNVYHSNWIMTNHRIIQDLGTRYSVPTIPMHHYLGERNDDGFLWWDFVHLTSLGQKLFAEKTYSVIVEEL
ncbi:MAG: SGNH/GDSL hydrolase family protein, partial [bacterium]|nr:SGNH/GDSL hydrolase family protein [bacterium]